MFRKALLFAATIFIVNYMCAQETQLQFHVENLGKNKTRIGWINPYGANVVQLNVQRSYDSLRNFRTIFSTPSPNLPENGFIDQEVLGRTAFYRIFFMLDNNSYYFTKSMRTPSGFESEAVKEAMDSSGLISVIWKDTVLLKLDFKDFKNFRDSILNQTKDSLFASGTDAVVLKPFIPQPGFNASIYLFIDRLGNVNIKLPLAKQRKYSIIFYDSDGKTELFAIKHVTDPQLMLDKTNFIHAGWFTFDLFEDDKLKERNRIFIQKEF